MITAQNEATALVGLDVRGARRGSSHYSTQHCAWIPHDWPRILGR